jgi:RAMA domain-containing protein
MPLFEVQSGGLVPFRRVPGGPELYEAEIERLLWDSLEEFTGVPLFPVARQPNIAGGGRPDIVALNEAGNVVVVEVKRDVDRGQLAQCLEYAGWARSTSLDELASLYHGGPQTSFAAWQEFTQTSAPVLVQRPPRLILVAREFHGRTESAFAFLTENRLPVNVLRVNIYEDQQGRRFIDVAAEHESELALPPPATGAAPVPRAIPQHPTIEGRRITVSDLLEAGLFEEGEELIWDRPRIGKRYEAVVLPNGAIGLDDGRTCATPSRAAMDAANVPAYDGWMAWRAPRLGNASLPDLRERLVGLHGAEEAAFSRESGEGESGTQTMNEAADAGTAPSTPA